MTRRAELIRGLIGIACAVMVGSTPARADGDSIKIGVLTDESGPYADFAGVWSVEAAKMAVEEFGGKVLGKPIEVIAADHQNKPDLGASIARQWFDRDGVEMITDLTTSSVALAVQDIAKEKGKIDIVVGAATSKLTEEACSPTGFHWTYDTYALGRGTGGALTEQGGKSWFFITADYTFGTALEDDTTKFILAAGGKVLGSVRHPLNTADFSSYLLQAQASRAQVVGLANAGTDATNAIKQAAEFGIAAGGQRLAGLLITLSEVHALGLEASQGLVLTTASYWDQNDTTRDWSQKFFTRTKRMPNMDQSGVYSGVLHYLKAVAAAGTTDGAAVAEKMRAIPVNDAFTKNGKVRIDGLMQHDMYLAEVKKPKDSKRPWDYLKIVQTIPGDQAFQPLAQSACPLVKH